MQIPDPGWKNSDPGWKKVGSGIRDKHPGSATLRRIRTVNRILTISYLSKAFKINFRIGCEEITRERAYPAIQQVQDEEMKR